METPNQAIIRNIDQCLDRCFSLDSAIEYTSKKFNINSHSIHNIWHSQNSDIELEDKS